jgi:hypothetical protein
MTEELIENYIGDNFKKWMIMKNMIFVDIPKGQSISISEVARRINIPRYHPYFIQVVKYLMDKSIIKIIKQIGPSKMVSIDFKALTREIENSKVFLEVDDYIKNTRDLWWY